MNRIGAIPSTAGTGRPLPLALRRAPVLALPLGLSMRLEDLTCAALFAFFSMQGSIPGIAPRQALEMTGSAATALTTIGGILTQAAVYGAIALLIVRHLRCTLRGLRAVGWATALAILAVGSTFWSVDPLLTARRSLPFALAGIFGAWFAARYAPERQIAILHVALVAVSLATIAIAVFFPEIGLDRTPGHGTDWQGVFTQKNACGRIMVLATATVLFGGRIHFARIVSLLLFGCVLLMSGSRGAWVIEAAVVLLWAVMRIARSTGRRIRLLLAIASPAFVLAGGVIAAAGFRRIMPLLGRDPTLSGRTAIWKQVFHFIRQRPLLGYGYNAFWRGMQGPSLQVNTAVHFIVEHAHNGYFEICLELGLAGLLIFLLSWAGAWRRVWPLWRDGRLDRIAFPMAMLVLVALYDVDENTLLIYNGLFWVLYVAALANIGIAARDHRHDSMDRDHATLNTHSISTVFPLAIHAAETATTQ